MLMSRGRPQSWPRDRVLDALLAGSTIVAQARRWRVSRQAIEVELLRLERSALAKLAANATLRDLADVDVDGNEVVLPRAPRGPRR